MESASVELAEVLKQSRRKEVDKQEARRNLVRLSLVPLAVAGFSLCWVIGVRLLAPPQEAAPESLGVLPASPD